MAASGILLVVHPLHRIINFINLIGLFGIQIWLRRSKTVNDILKSNFTRQNSESLKQGKHLRFKEIEFFVFLVEAFQVFEFHENDVKYANHIEICSANQWTGFYMITASVMKEFRRDLTVKLEVKNSLNYSAENQLRKNRLKIYMTTFLWVKTQIIYKSS